MSKILLVGNDFRLLATRSALLAHTKVSVSCCNASEARLTLQRERFDLVILCHSLTGQQATEIIEMIQQKFPGMKILMIVTDPSRIRPPKGIPLDAIVSPDPGSLIRRSSELLLRQIHLVESEDPPVKPLSIPKTNGHFSNHNKNNNLN